MEGAVNEKMVYGQSSQQESGSCQCSQANPHCPEKSIPPYFSPTLTPPMQPCMVLCCRPHAQETNIQSISWRRDQAGDLFGIAASTGIILGLPARTHHISEESCTLTTEILQPQLLLQSIG